MFRRLFGKDKEKTETPDLSNWNEIGRKIAVEDSAKITAYHEGKSDGPELAKEERGPEMAEAVLQRVIALNIEGRGAEARLILDPAHAPFIPEMEKGGRGLTCCAIIGSDEYLVQQGTTHQENASWHINGDVIQPLEGIASFAWSRNRKFFLTAFQDGHLTLGHQFGSSEAEHIPALPGSAFVPIGLPEDYSSRFALPSDQPDYSRVSVSDDGTKLLLCDEERGVILLAKDGPGWHSHLLFPSVDLNLKEQMQEFWEDDDEFSPFFDMIHAALSPNGRFAAVGTQDDGHHILELDKVGKPSVHAHLGYLSEYPHNACFSNDSQFVALNSCHFYNGVTFASELAAVQGLTTEPYQQHGVQSILNDYLRVYASGYLPASMTGQETGAFLLAGSTFAACVAPDGKLLWELGFGSSAGAVDVCPKTKRVLIASHSGMLHLLDPSQTQSPMIFSGYNAPQELRRWLFWDSLEQPIIW